MMNNYKHWDLQKDEAGIFWLGIDRKDAAVNTFNEAVLDELNSLLKEIHGMQDAKGLIIYSAKAKGFIAGADVHAFADFRSSDKVMDFLRKGQTVFAQLEALAIPTVAMIDGFCMGGGLELALACDYRIASEERETRLGLPEILLGIHPGWGGVVRLSRLIGGFYALSRVILTGASLSASQAKQLGFIDDAVPLRQLKRAALYYIQHTPPKHKPTFLQKASNYGWARKLLAMLLRNQVAKKLSKEHYPAPFAVIDFWEKEGGFGERAYLKEAESVEKLVTQGETAHNLIRIFLLRERLKGFAKKSDLKIQHVHVVGAGVMGGDIANWCALQGIKVTLQDKSYAQIAPVIARAQALYKKKLKKPRLIQAALDRLIPDPDGFGIAQADVIIEAIFENLSLKQTLMQDIEAKAKKEAILATNTSSFSLSLMSKLMKKPERLVGLHFFNPVAKMDLVEVVSDKTTPAALLEHAFSFVGQIGKLPLPVKSSPGFLVNRVLMPYLLECVTMLEEGYHGEVIDQAATDFGMLMGPVELADTVGMDICLAVAENLTTSFGGQVPEKLREMVKTNKLGRKTGEGFYKYKNGEIIKSKPLGPIDPDIALRLVGRIILESKACLHEGVVEDADLLDAGMIFGTGFAPFRGGPMHYAQQLGEDNLKEMFKKLSLKYGERFHLNERIHGKV